MQEVGGENLFKKVLKLSSSGLGITIHPLSQTEIRTILQVGKSYLGNNHILQRFLFVGASQFGGGFSANTNELLIRKASTMNLSNS